MDTDVKDTANRKTRILLSLVGAVALAAGCDDKRESSNEAGNVSVTPSGGQDGGTGGSAGASGDAGGSPDAGTGGSGGTGGTAGAGGAGGAGGAAASSALAPAAPIGLVVVGSDYQSTSISVVSA